MGRTKDALVEIDKSLEPQNGMTGYVLLSASWCLLLCRDYDRATELFEQAIERTPSHVHAYPHVGLGMIHALQGHPIEALAAFDRYESSHRSDTSWYDSHIMAWRGRVFIQQGEPEKAEEQLQRLLEAREIPGRALPIASLLCAMGRIDETFEWLDKSLEEREPQTLDIPVLPDFDSIRSDPRFAVVLKRLGLPG